MFKTLFSRMLTIYLAVTLSVLILLGVMFAGMFSNQYSEEKKTEIRKEAEQINSVITKKYIDDSKKHIASEELAIIARKYDALIQIRFNNTKYGIVSFHDQNSADKWAMLEGLDVSEIYNRVATSGQGEIIDDIYGGINDFPIMTLVTPVRDYDNEIIGILFFHVDMSNINSSVSKVYYDVLLSAIIAIMLAVIAVSYATGFITKPITEMSKVVKKFSKGAFEERIPVKGIDEVSELGNNFNNMADELDRLEQSRKSFVANVSHELRSPLTSMRGFLEAMRDGTIPKEEFDKYFDLVISENKRLSLMVNDLLDLARIESGQIKTEFKVFDINELIGVTLITFEARINSKKMNVDFIPDENGDVCYVNADPDQIGQVLRNLIDNAIKFSKEKGELIITVTTDKNKAYISIKDSGEGIDENDIPYIFDRFYKAEKAHTPSGSSTGLGLAIVKRIINEHDQTIKVNSKKGEYCEFVFTLEKANDNHNTRSKKNIA